VKHWKLLFISLISILAVLPVSGAGACGWVDYSRYYNLLDPTLLLSGQYSPLFYTTPQYANHWINGDWARDDNVDEWARFLGTADMFDVIQHYHYEGKTISKLGFARRLLELHNKVKKDPGGARAWFLLGNAYYNITYFGKSWDLVGYFRSGSYYSGFTDCSRALSYYRKASTLAEDRELKAECLFMMAKCRQNMFDLKYNTEDYGYGPGFEKGKKYIRENEYWKIEQEKQKMGYRQYFDILKYRFGNTRYYQNAIKECEYLRYYASRF